MRLNSLASARILLLVLAILLWLAATLMTQTTRTVAVPIMIQGLNPALAVATPLTTIPVKINGRLRDVARVGEDVLSATLDMSEITRPGAYNQPVMVSLRTPKVNLVSPSTVGYEIAVEGVTQKTVPVTAIPSNLPAVGFNLAEVTVSPSSVTLTGAPSLLATVSEVVTRINVQGHRTSFTVPSNVGLSVNDQLTHVVSINPSSVAVTANIEKGDYRRNLGIKPEFKGSLPTGYWIREVTLDPMTAQVMGNRKILDKLESLKTTPIELGNRTSDFNDEVSLSLPNGVTIIGANLFKVTVKVSLLASYRQITVTPEYVGLSDGSSVASSNPDTIEAVVSGDPIALSNLKPSDVHLKLDLTGKVSGPTTIPLTPALFSLPAGLQVVSFTPSQIDIIISRE